MSQTPYVAIDAYIEEQMRHLGIPGVSLAIVEGDRIVHAAGFGRARPGGEIPCAETPFFIGSLTKSFTALAVMQLVEAGKIELDAPVRRYLPWFRVADPVASAQMTVRHLLNQTSGLSSMDGEIALAGFEHGPEAIKRQVRAMADVRVNRPVGTKFEYSNLNYDVLGLIIEVTSGESYAGYIQRHIFDPLGMRHSYSCREVARQNGLARGHRHWFGQPIPAPEMPIASGTLPSGQLISCAEDMAHYLVAHLNGGRYGEVQILSEAGIETLHHGEAEVMMMGTPMGRYGMGWFDEDVDKTKIISHSGNVPDFSAFMALVPEQNTGLVMLLNADPYGLPPITEEFGAGAAALLAGKQAKPVKLDFVPWVFRLLPLVPLLQIVGAAATLRRVSRWRQEPEHLPGRGSLWGKHLLLPLLSNLALAAFPAYLHRRRIDRFLWLFMPDLACITLISGVFAGVWAFLRTRLMLGAIKNIHQEHEE